MSICTSKFTSYKVKVFLYTRHLRPLARDNQRPNLTSVNGLWYISFGQNIYILGNLGYVVPTRKVIALEIKTFPVSKINSCAM